MSLPDSVHLFVTARWKSPFDEILWEKLKGFLSKPEEIESREIVLWPAFENQKEPLKGRIAGLTGKLSRSKETIAWDLSCIPAPASHLDSPKPPIEEHLRISEKIGGFGGLRQLLDDSFQKGPAPVAAYELDVRVWQEDGWKSTLLHHPATTQDGRVGDLGENGFVEQMGMRFENGTNGLEEFTVVYCHTSPHYHVDISARAQLEWDTAFFFPNAEKLAELVLTRIFSYKPLEPA